ncbi:MAG: transglutaminase domain-containing protein [Chloroflexota bacterium]
MDRNPVRNWDFWSAVILTLALMIASRRLYATNWTFGLGNVLLLTLLGVILGLALGSSKFSRLAISLLGLGYSVVLLPLVIAGLLYKGTAWMERMSSLGGQLAISFVQLVTHQPVNDPTLFITFVAIVFWIISLAAGSTLTRSGNFTGAVLPAGVVLVIVQIFDLRSGDHVFSLALYAFLCLLLLGRLAYVHRWKSWKDRNVWLPEGSNADLNIILGVTALALVILAWTIPVSGRPVSSARIMWENLTRSWQAKQDLDRAVASLRGNRPQTPEFYGATLSLGQQARVGDDIYLRIQVPPAYSEFRYYWRVRSYDFYQDGKWHTDNAFVIPIAPDQESLSLPDSKGPTGKFTFTAWSDGFNTLVTPPHPIWISRPAKLTFFPTADEKMDPILFLATPSILAGEQYAVRANIYEPTIANLRKARINYPTWVSDNFLQLPADLPEEVVNLASQITAGAETPYEQAAAITVYLRTNITYSATVESPPEDRDPLLWFLFDTKTGFCNYYATAEVILLRSLGIPAQMVVGFASGEYEAPDQYTVLQQDAHAWPEVYFPGSGWVEFEPTGNQPPLVRLEGNDQANGQGVSPTPDANEQAENNRLTQVIPGESNTGSGTPLDPMQILTIILSVVSILVIAGFLAYIFGGLDKVLWAFQRVFRKPIPVFLKDSLEKISLVPPNWLVRWAYSAELTPTIRSFTVVYRSLHWLGEEIPPAQTPAEAAAQLTRRLPEISDEIRVVLHECQRSLYGRRPGDLPIALRAAKAIRRVSFHAALQQRWNILKGKFKR